MSSNIFAEGTLTNVSVLDNSVVLHLKIEGRSGDIFIDSRKCPGLVHAIVTNALGKSQKEYEDDMPTIGPSELSAIKIKIFIGKDI